MADLKNPHTDWILPQDDECYILDEDEKTFFKKETRIEDDNELKKHVITVQTKAYAIYQYPCIRIFDFMRLRLGRLPAYDDLLRLGKEREGAIFVDLGCCCSSCTRVILTCLNFLFAVGNDVRKAIQDGYPMQNAIASDLLSLLGFWDLGHEMFRSTPESFPVPFVEGDVFDPSFLEAVPPLTKGSPPTTPIPSLGSVTSLNPLRGHVSAVFTGAFFHLFHERDQERLAQALAGLLSPEPGSLLLGAHGGRTEKGDWQPTVSDYKMFCHSPESWKSLWEGLFGKGNVEVKAELRRYAVVCSDLWRPLAGVL